MDSAGAEAETIAERVSDAIGLIDSAEEALEEERRERQRLAESEERRKDVRLMVEVEERMTACRDRSRRENVLLAATVVCVLATVALLFITALSGEVVILSGSVFSALLSVGGGYMLRAATHESPTSDS